MPGFSGAQLVSKCQHHKGGMICQHENRLFQLRLIIGKGVLRLKGVFRVPVGKLRLHHHTQLIRRGKSRFRGTVGVEAHTVDTVGFVGFQNRPPFLLRHGRAPGLREFPAVCLAAEKESPSVDCKTPFSVIAEIPHAKGNPFLRKAGKLRLKFIEISLIFVPPPHILRERNILYFHCAFSRRHVYLHGSRLL